MTDDSTQLERLRNAVDRLCLAGDGDASHAHDDLMEVAAAAGNLSPAFRRRYPSIPWMVLAEIGRVIDRAGDELNARSLTVTLEREIPELRARLRHLS